MSRSDAALAAFLSRPRDPYLVGQIRREARFGQGPGETLQRMRDEYDRETENLRRMLAAYRVAWACRTHHHNHDRPLRAA